MTPELNSAISKAAEDIAQKKFDALLPNQPEYRRGFRKGATEALTNPDLYEKAGLGKREDMRQNAAQVLSKFIWKYPTPKNLYTGSLEKGFEVDETVLLPYLMQFENWLFTLNPQPHDKE